MRRGIKVRLFISGRGEERRGGREGRSQLEGKRQERGIVVRQVMQKQVRICFGSNKKRNVHLKEEQNLKGSKQVRTKPHECMKGRNRVGKTDQRRSSEKKCERRKMNMDKERERDYKRLNVLATGTYLGV